MKKVEMKKDTKIITRMTVGTILPFTYRQMMLTMPAINM